MKINWEAEIIIEIFDRKKLAKIQTIKFESDFILKTNEFKYCENNKSYKSNKHLKSNENDYGDLIVADLNFDGKEDIAIKREEGGNGGPVYNFYLQENQQFIYDKYLSNEMSYFPEYINTKTKMLHVKVRVDTFNPRGNILCIFRYQ